MNFTELSPKILHYTKKVMFVVWILILAALIGVPLFIYSVKVNFLNLYGSLPSYEQLANPQNDLSSELYSVDGVILGKYYRENRTNVDFSDLSPNLVNALLAVEDHRFESHSGIDFKGILRAGLLSVALGKQQGGGSTITQQLAKNLFRTRTKKYEGKLSSVPGFGMLIVKVKEWIVAVELEKSYTKREIIAMFLNTIELGNNTHGIHVGAKTYFNKTPKELNIEESAFFVGLVNNPSRYDPIRFPENSLRKRNEVLQKLQKRDLITKLEFDSLKQLPIALDYRIENHNEGLAPYFRNVVRGFLMSWSNEHGYDLWEDGLKIYTTIDSRMQAYAEKGMEAHMAKLQKVFDDHLQGRTPWVDEKGRDMANYIQLVLPRTEAYRNLKKIYGSNEDSINYYLNIKKPMKVFSWDGEKEVVMSSIDSLKYFKQFLQAGFMAMDPNTGHIKAWVGGINHKYFKYDHVKQGKRQPGSTFKAIVYATAIENGYTPCYEAIDAPFTFSLPGQDPPTWTPPNSDGKYSGEKMTIREAMAKSVNSITAFIMNKVGAPAVVDMARRLGVDSPLDAVPSLCLGAGGDISLYEMVGAYSTFVNEGVWTEPFYITRIEDKNGNILQEFTPKTVEAISEETAYLMVHMLKGATTERGGTALGLKREIREGNEIGAKTGTTNNASDGWFMGITKDLVAGAWVGGDDKFIHFRNWYLGQGARTAMPIWENFFLQVYADPELGVSKGEFKKPRQRISIEMDCDKYQDMTITEDGDTVEIQSKPKRQFELSF